MELKDFLVDAIKNKKPKVEITSNISDITLDAMIKMAARSAGIKVAYNFTRSGNTFIINFTYPAEVEVADRKDYYSPGFGVGKKVEERVVNKERHLYDTGDESFLYELDVRNGNILYIHTKDPTRFINMLNTHSYTMLGISEGVVSFNTEPYQETAYDFIFKLSFHIGMDFSEFMSRINKGEEKAKEIAKDVFNRASLPPEVICIIAYAYMQRNVTYDHDYVRNWKTIDQQNINNHTCYGSLCLKKAVCEGYSWGLIKILREMGLEAIPVTGKYKGIGHEWTKVKINGNWYNIDSTVPAVEEGIIVGTFLASDDYLRRFNYIFEDRKEKAIDKRYESQIEIMRLFGNFSANADYYRSLGVDPQYLYLQYFKGDPV